MREPRPLSEVFESCVTDKAWPEQVLRYLERAEEICETRCLQVDRHCFLTGKPLFLKKAVRLSIPFQRWGYNKYIDNEVWIDAKQCLLLQLRGS